MCDDSLAIEVREAVAGLVDVALLRRRLEKLLALVDRTGATLNVILCDDAEIHALNRTYRHIDRPTDVLSFPEREGEPFDYGFDAVPALGDLAISLETASRQVADGCLPRLYQGAAPAWSLDREVAFLCVHGVLHLMGFDHMQPEDAVIMEAEELRLLWPVLAA